MVLTVTQIFSGRESKSRIPISGIHADQHHKIQFSTKDEKGIGRLEPCMGSRSQGRSQDSSHLQRQIWEQRGPGLKLLRKSLIAARKERVDQERRRSGGVQGGGIMARSAI